MIDFGQLVCTGIDSLCAEFSHQNSDLVETCGPPGRSKKVACAEYIARRRSPHSAARQKPLRPSYSDVARSLANPGPPNLLPSDWVSCHKLRSMPGMCVHLSHRVLSTRAQPAPMSPEIREALAPPTARPPCAPNRDALSAALRAVAPRNPPQRHRRRRSTGTAYPKASRRAIPGRALSSSPSYGAYQR